MPIPKSKQNDPTGQPDLPDEKTPVVLHHGDALDVLRALPDGCVDAVVTDPPYCSGAATEAGRGSATHQGLRSDGIRSGRFDWFEADNMTTSGLVWLLRSVAREAGRVMTKSGSMLVFCDWRMAFTLGPAMESAGFRLRNLVVWDKGHFGCGTGFRPQHELVIHLTRRAPGFHAADVGNVVRSKRVVSGDRAHPTEKPVDVLRDLIRVVCPVGGIVIDPFAGSGTTGLAAKLEGRRAILVETSRRYVNVIKNRLGMNPPREAKAVKMNGRLV